MVALSEKPIAHVSIHVVFLTLLHQEQLHQGCFLQSSFEVEVPLYNTASHLLTRIIHSSEQSRLAL